MCLDYLGAWGTRVIKSYTKKALSFEEQLTHLKGHGLGVADEAAALKQLACVSYYRLSGYLYPFRERSDQGKVLSRFKPAANFEEAAKLYEFDRRLRLLVLDAIERVEVAVRTRVTYEIGHRYGPFGHVEAVNFHPQFQHDKWLKKIEAEAAQSSDEFIRHYKANYDGFPRLPVWMLTEVMSFGALSRLYQGLKNESGSDAEDKKAVSQYFNIHHKRLGDWLHTLTYVRNLCAHHSRLWNRALSIKPDKVKDPLWLPPFTPRNDRLFYVLLMLRHLLKASKASDVWACEVTRLLAPFADIEEYRVAMGIPKDWRDHPLWK